MKTFSALLAAGLCVSTAAAQQNPDSLLNQPVPEVTAYDAEGNPIAFREKMRGGYSVVVFGCLT